MSEARAIAEEAARASYGRLLAWLSARSGDLAAAEDALADAFRAALETWPEDGPPRAPEAWLLTTARRRLIDDARRARTRADKTRDVALVLEEAAAASVGGDPFPDERLKLLFICAHPAIERRARTPLMLQTVLGLDAARIASAFLVSPAAMAQRLVRAKQKIKAARIPFETPGPEDFDARRDAVLDAVYAAFTTGWARLDDPGGDLTGEAIFLAELMVSLAPADGEAWGLFSLMLYAEARRGARRCGGRYVPLSEQKAHLWDHRRIAAAERALRRAHQCGAPGRFQIEAAIQSAHAIGKIAGRDVKDDVAGLYRQLTERAPSIGADVGYAAALSSAGREREGLSVLDGIDQTAIGEYQPYWAVRAHVLSTLGETASALQAYDRAIGLCADAAERRFLQERRERAIVKQT